MKKSIFVILFLSFLGCQMVLPPEDYPLTEALQEKGDSDACMFQNGKVSPSCFEPKNLHFDNVFNLVFRPSCVRCHSEKSGNEGDINLETHEAVTFSLEDIENALIKGSMPPRKAKKPLTADQKDLVLQWIKANAPASPRADGQ
jgi:hypothetical protein